MFRKLFAMAIVLCAAQFVAGCSQKPEQTAEKVEGEILAEVDGEIITLDKYTETVKSMPAKLRKEIVGKEGKVKVLNDLIREELLYKEALKRGYENKPDVVEDIERMKRGMILQAFVKELLQQDITFSDEEITAYYNEHKNEFDRPEMVKVSHIVLFDENRAKEVLAKVRQGGDFAELAKQYSDDANTARRGGDLGFMPRGKMSPEFDEAAFALKNKGDVSNIVKSSFGFHIIKLNERVPYIESFLNATIKARINRILTKERQEEIINNFTDELKKQYTVTSREELLDSFVMPRPAGHGRGFMGTGGGFH